MFCWLDLMLIGIMIWGAVTGYLSGLKQVVIRLCVRFGSLLVSLPFASNCAIYMRPVLEKVFRGNWQRAMPTGSIAGPWGDVLAIHVDSEVQLVQRLILLALNISALCFLMLTLLFVFRLIEKPCKSEYRAYGSLAGFASGIVTVVYFLAIAPALFVGTSGLILTAALDESWLATFFAPLVQGIVHFVAPFVI